ncbi:sigma-70 family RNA polymerase sigma factor [Micromonospora sp. HM5-17]|jgi:RNA polymerase sigma-70 factor (ECF subfamily)|uniref:sigma-70 family RNA polymerase sigma factor n=1 Tax=Micromonospora sp. HM5-17 TaxID=2487710 RepID=UPI000F49A0E4|nr:sigma-70 family RNA polymerase sigma factor [Micromonospora sp. HM5-17]ROT29350.1 sigma-70 family RNA polymerase sigma factor [Micromonospora sp. HM5-17]
MDDQAALADRFDRSRGHLRAVAYRMLGSVDEADDAVQETWLRVSRADAGAIANLTGWLTTVVSRVCLDMLRARERRREESTDLADFEPTTPHDGAVDPADEAVLADSVGLALLVVLDRLGPAERVAFVLHDLFAVPFDEIAAIVGRTPVAAKKLASRARHRVHGAPTVPVADLARQRRVVEAFLAAARAGDLAALLAVLDPDVVRRTDRMAGRPGEPAVLRGADRVAAETVANVTRARFARPALVDGVVGAVVAPRGRLRLVLRITTDGDRVTAFDVVADPARLRALDLAVLDLPTCDLPAPDRSPLLVG